MKKILALLSLGVLLLALVACGGGGASVTTAIPTEPPVTTPPVTTPTVTSPPVNMPAVTTPPVTTPPVTTPAVTTPPVTTPPVTTPPVTTPAVTTPPVTTPPVTTEPTPTLYTVTFFYHGGSFTEEFAQGTIPTAPAVEGYETVDALYSFVGWDKEITAVSGDATYTAVYSSVVRTYSVTFVYGGKSETVAVPYGTIPTAPAVEGYETVDALYSFVGWDKEITAVSGDATYTAVYSSVVRTYSVTFVYGGKSEKIAVPYGTIPTAPTETDYETSSLAYLFLGWDKEITAVSGDVTYTAQYRTVTLYTIRWVLQGQILKTAVREGELPVPPAFDTTVYTDTEILTFTGWSKAIAPASGTAIYTALYDREARLYSVTFVYGGKSETVRLPYGATPEAPLYLNYSTADTAYTFTAWDKEIAAVTGDAVYTAQYETKAPAEYTIRWVLYDRVEKMTVREYEMPTPPEFDKVIELGNGTVTFIGWNREIAPATANAVYTALYETVYTSFTVRFTVDGVEYASTETRYGELPVLPASTPTKAGYSSMLWLNADTPVKEQGRVCEALFTVTDHEQLLLALSDKTPFGYDSSHVHDNGGDIFTASNAMLYLLYEIRGTEYTDSEYYTRAVSRVLEQLRYMIKSSNNAAPQFDLRANWPYAHITAIITLCHETPVIWDQLTASEKERLTFVMECFAYVLTLGTDDDNEYETGPGLRGGFGKDWNPNYRLANVLPMLYLGRFFGGADALDAILLAFDYDAVIARMKEYGFKRALTRWTKSPAEKEDGTSYPSQRDFMMNGGPAYLNASGDEGTPAGTGVGVRTAYTYLGYRVDQVQEIVGELFTYNYSGGRVVSKYGFASDGSPLAYIVGNLTSPYEGELGLMREFVGSDSSGIRSSADYCEHDFMMVAGSLLAMESLGLYDPLEEENFSLFRLVWVGNQDLIFKLGAGYVSYANGALSGTTSESAEYGYLFMKSWWTLRYGAMKLSDFPEPPVIYDPVILNETYEGATVNSNNSSEYLQSVNYYTKGMNGATMTTVTGGGNTYLQIKLPAKSSSEPRINYEPIGGLNACMDEYTSVTVTLDLSAPSSGSYFNSPIPKCEFRLRGSVSNSDDTVSVFTIDSSGNVKVGGRTTVGRLSTTMQTFSFRIDFAAGTITASLNGTVKATYSFSAPSASSAETPLEWLDTLTQFVFNWYFSKNSGSKDQILYLDNFSIVVDVPKKS